jgi:hypothetical protein
MSLRVAPLSPGAARREAKCRIWIAAEAAFSLRPYFPSWLTLRSWIFCVIKCVIDANDVLVGFSA